MVQAQQQQERRFQRTRVTGNPDELVRDTDRLYRYEINQVDLLSSDEVARLARCIERGRAELLNAEREQRPVVRQLVEEGERAKEHLIESNLRLVVAIARRYRSLHVDLMDLVQEGNLGLMHAARKFDPGKGRFGSYAARWIRMYITMALTQQARTIRVPLYKVEELKQLERTRRRLKETRQQEPTLEDLAAKMGVSIQEVIDLLAVQPREVVSLDMGRGDDEGSTLADTVEDDPHYGPERQLLRETLKAHIHDLVNGLTWKERRVIELRYGLEPEHELGLADVLSMHYDDWDSGRPHSLSETGKKIGLSYEAVRQIELRALQNLYAPSLARRLQEFLAEE